MSSIPNPVSPRVVEAVAESKGIDPTTLPPLSRVLDADALDDLVATYTDSTSRIRDPLTIEFTYADCHVVVRGDGTIEVQHR